MTLHVTGALCVSALLCGSLAQGQVPVVKRGALVVYHRTGIVKIRQIDDRVVTAGQLPEQTSVTLKSDEALSIWIADPNPLLFSYGIPGEIQLKKTADFEQATKFAGELKTLVGLFASLSASVEDARNTASELIKAARSPEGLELTTEGRRLDALATDLESMDSALKDLRGKLRELFERIEEVPAVVELTTKGPDQVKEAQARVRSWNVQELLKQIEELYRKLDEQDWQNLIGRQPPTFPLEARARARDETTATRIDELYELVGRLRDRVNALEESAGQAGLMTGFLRRRPAVEQAAQFIRSFESDLATVDEPIQLRIGTAKTTELLYDGKNIQTVKVKIEPDGDFAKIAASSGRAIGEFAVELRPYRAVGLTVSPAYVFSFVKQPTYSAIKQDDDKFKIVEAGEEFAASNLGAMLLIVPERFRTGGFGLNFQTGVSPVKDKVGFYFGGGVLFSELFSLNLGLVVQQVQKLAGGQGVGDLLETESDLVTATKFKPGLYVGIGLSF